MTTDAPSPAERAARLEALRQRRAADVPASRGRRRHAATGARLIAGGLSAAGALGLMGAMAQAANTGTNASAPTAGVVASPVIVDAPSRSGVAAVAPRVAPTAATPMTRSRGS